MSTGNQIRSKSDFKDDAVGQQEYWKAEIEAARKELKKWHEKGDKVTKLYLDSRTNGTDSDRNFNLFSANTGILKASLYARIPKPSVARRFNDYDDDVARVASIILERALSYELENDFTFDSNVKCIIEDRLIAGLGTAWVRFDTESEQQEIQISNVVDNDGEQYETPEQQMQEIITDEQTPVDYVHWKDFFYSPARTWSEVRWVARRVYMNNDEIVERFGEDAVREVDMSDDGDSKTSSIEPKNLLLKQGEVFEIWDKSEEKVFWISLSASKILDSKDDPYELPGFFPCPKPLIANATTSNFMPQPDYTLVQDQYAELNELNNKISNLVAACRVAGIYNSKNKEIADVLNDNRENVLTAVTNWEAFTQTGGLKANIEFIPISQYAEVLLTLTRARDTVKAQIYELTGISDIMRGQSSGYESGAAQQIKSQYASLRLTAQQNEVAEFLSDLIAKKACLMTKYYEPQRLLARAGQLNAADTQLIGPAIELLKNESLSHFRVAVSVDSLQMPNFDSEKKDRLEALQSIGQFLQSAVPMAKNMPELAPMLINFIKFGIASFKNTREIEGIADRSLAQIQMASQQPKQPTPDQQAEQAKAQQAQAEHQLAMAEIQLKATVAQNNFAVDQAKLQLAQGQLELDKARFQADASLKQFEAQSDAITKERALEQKRETAHLNAEVSLNATEKAHENAIIDSQVTLVGHQLKTEAINRSAETTFPAQI